MSLVGFPLSHKTPRLNTREGFYCILRNATLHISLKLTDVNRNIAEYNTNHAAGKSSLAPKSPRDLTKMCGHKRCDQTPRDLTKMCPRRNALQSTSYRVAMAATRYKNQSALWASSGLYLVAFFPIMHCYVIELGGGGLKIHVIEVAIEV